MLLRRQDTATPRELGVKKIWRELLNSTGWRRARAWAWWGIVGMIPFFSLHPFLHSLVLLLQPSKDRAYPCENVLGTDTLRFQDLQGKIHVWWRHFRHDTRKDSSQQIADSKYIWSKKVCRFPDSSRILKISPFQCTFVCPCFSLFFLSFSFILFYFSFWWPLALVHRYLACRMCTMLGTMCGYSAGECEGAPIRLQV